MFCKMALTFDIQHHQMTGMGTVYVHFQHPGISLTLFWIIVHRDLSTWHREAYRKYLS